MKMVYFKTWVYKKFGLDNSILGDLARDIKKDNLFPNTDSPKEIREYMTCQIICENAEKAFNLLLYMYSTYYRISENPAKARFPNG